MPAMTSLLKRADSNKSTTYITLAVVFGIIGFICLVITVVLMSRLRRNDRKLDRERAQNTRANSKDFAPQFSEKGSVESHDYPRAEDFPMPQNYPRPPMPPPSIPADILHHGGQDIHYDVQQRGYSRSPSPQPQRPVHRPSLLFDQQQQQQQQQQQSFAYQQQQNRAHHNSVDSYMPPMWQAPPPVRRQYEPAGQPIDLNITAPDAAMIEDGQLQRPPMPQRESSYSIYSVYGQTAGTEAPPIHTAKAVGRAPSLGRSPSMLRKLLADRAAKAGMPPPMPPMPEQPQPQPQQQRYIRPETTLMPYDLETATPGPTPIDVPPPSAIGPAGNIAYQRPKTYATNAQPSMRIIEEEDPFSDERTPTALDDRLTLLQPPPSPPRRSPVPLTITIKDSHTKGMAGHGSPPMPTSSIPVPPLPVRSPERANASFQKPVTRKPVMQRPPAIPVPKQQLEIAPDFNGTVTPNLLAEFAARLRPETREFNAVPVAIPDTRDDGDFRITMRS